MQKYYDLIDDIEDEINIKMFYFILEFKMKLQKLKIQNLLFHKLNNNKIN